MMVSGPAIWTLVLFILSILCVTLPFSFPIRLPFIGRRRVRINLRTAPIIAILILWATRCIGTKEIRNGFVGTDGAKPYNILVLFFSRAYMAITLDITGVLQAAAFWVSNKGGSNGWRLFLYFYMMSTVASVCLGNDSVILSGTVFLIYYTKVNQLNPIAWLVAEFAAANTASMVLFVGNPTNVVICDVFRINNMAFTAYTILPFFACSITCFIALAFQFRDPRYLLRHINVSGDLDVRSMLRDPIGAWVGSLFLGTCLVVVIVVSFFHVDVWMISLPFGVAKLIFDLWWDHYRYVHAISNETNWAKKSDDDLTNVEDDIMLQQLAAHRVSDPDMKRHITENTANSTNTLVSAQEASGKSLNKDITLRVPLPTRIRLAHNQIQHTISSHFPTIYLAFPRLPFALAPFMFSQFILIEGLEHQGWITIFAHWLVIATGRQMYPTIWVVGVLGIILCNLTGTNIGATILLTKVIRTALASGSAPPSPQSSTTDVTVGNMDAFSRSAAIALAVAANIGAVSFTFSASLAGLLWKTILNQKGIFIRQLAFAYWNLVPLVVMTTVGLAVVCAEMAVLF